MAPKRTIELRLGQRLEESGKSTTSVSLPHAVHHRLDVLAERTYSVRATRQVIVGMLIAEASLDGAELVDRILRYREKTVGDVVPTVQDEAPAAAPETTDDDNVVHISKRGPGRPRAAG